jgi:diguanylate cyclase (GGDEF)-like protein
VQQQGYGQFEFRHRLATGEVRDVAVDASPLTWGGRSLLYSIVHDITDKKRAEQALHESEALLRTTEAIAHIGGWEWNPVSRRGSWTEETRRILNQPAGDDQGLRARDLVRALKRFDPDTQHSLRALVRRCSHEGKPWDITVRVPVSAGDERWVRVIGQGRWEAGRLVRMIGNVMDVTEQIRAQARIRHLANHDALTGLPSLRLARDRLRMAIEGARRESRLAALLFVDLDGFKAVNDGYGHEAGDRVLKEVAARLKGSVRQTDTVARIGGDEFLMILPGLKTASEAEQLGDKAIAALCEPVAWGESLLHVGASIGIALYPRDGVDGRQLLRLADQAMYRVKRTTKNGYGFVEEPSIG